MKQFAFQVLALVLVTMVAMWITFTPGILNAVLGIGGAPAPTNQTSASTTNQKIQVTSSDGQTLKGDLDIELATTQDQRSKGLGGRDSLGANAGMLFIWEQPLTPTFWMKGLRFPLDIIWINGDSIIGFEENVPAPTEGQSDQSLPRYSPTGPVDKVLEVNSGFVQERGIIAGDKLKQVN